jgi:hypothetical protein
MRVLAILLACVFLGGCETAAEHQAKLQEQMLEQMAAQDDAYCRTQKQQSYDACRQTRASYRQTMMTGAVGAQIAAGQQPQPGRNPMCLPNGGGIC